MPRFVTAVQRPMLAGLLALALLSVVAMPSSAGDMPPSGYPSWQDVEEAQRSESATAAEIRTITGLLDGLQSRFEKLGDEAVNSAAEYSTSQTALEAATARVELISARSAAAQAQVARYKKELGTLAAESYKTGGTTMGFFVAVEAVRTDSVHGLNLMQKVGDKTAALVAKAASAEKAAEAQAGQERIARAERERLADDAESSLTAAQAAQEAVASHVEEQQERSDELTAQLAALKGTTAAAESDFRKGQAARAAYEATQAAKREAAEEQARQAAARAAEAASQRLSDTGRPGPRPAVRQPVIPTPVNPAPVVPAPQPAAVVPAPAPPPAPAAPPVVPVVPGGAVNDPAGAKAYASGRLGAFGWGQDQFQCLVNLWTKESNWLTTATNPSSGAYGIAPSLPASKYSSAGSDWLTNYRTQVDWGLSYIKSRYGSPCAAWAHSVAVNWY